MQLKRESVKGRRDKNVWLPACCSHQYHVGNRMHILGDDEYYLRDVLGVVHLGKNG